MMKSFSRSFGQRVLLAAAFVLVSTSVSLGASGTLYGVDLQNNFYSIDRVSGTCTLKGVIGSASGNYQNPTAGLASSSSDLVWALDSQGRWCKFFASDPTHVTFVADTRIENTAWPLAMCQWGLSFYAIGWNTGSGGGTELFNILTSGSTRDAGKMTGYSMGSLGSDGTYGYASTTDGRWFRLTSDLGGNITAGQISETANNYTSLSYGGGAMYGVYQELTQYYLAAVNLNDGTAGNLWPINKPILVIVFVPAPT